MKVEFPADFSKKDYRKALISLKHGGHKTMQNFFNSPNRMLENFDTEYKNVKIGSKVSIKRRNNSSSFNSVKTPQYSSSQSNFIPQSSKLDKKRASSKLTSLNTDMSFTLHGKGIKFLTTKTQFDDGSKLQTSPTIQARKFNIKSIPISQKENLNPERPSITCRRVSISMKEPVTDSTSAAIPKQMSFRKTIIVKDRLSSKVNMTINKILKESDQASPKRIEIFKLLNYKKKNPTYALQHQIGKGSYAIVYLANDFVGKKLVAVKVYNKEKMASITRQNIIENEIEVLKMISHENIVNFIKMNETESEIHLVFELIKGISLGSWVKSFSTYGVPEKIAKPVLKKILNAIAYLHTKGICHRDLKLENVMLTADLNPKLIDFGFACQDSGRPNLALFCGTPNYMSPEIIKKIPYSGILNDCWAFGVLFYRVVVGYFPFSTSSTEISNKNILSCNYKIPGFVSNESRQVIEALLVAVPSNRISMQNLKSFRFFN
jgi:tRNA A-37 threonylcarbamoyl transferase component Bud32